MDLSTYDDLSDLTPHDLRAYDLTLRTKNHSVDIGTGVPSFWRNRRIARIASEIRADSYALYRGKEPVAVSERGSLHSIERLRAEGRDDLVERVLGSL